MAYSISTFCRRLVSLGFPQELLHSGVPLSACTSFRIGGPCDLLCEPTCEREAALLLQAAADEGIPVAIIGNGTNLLVRDGGIRGVVLRMKGNADGIRMTDDLSLTAPAGVSLAQLAAFAAAHGLDGLVPLSGIPGTLGGAVVMNAGAYGGAMAQIVTAAEGIDMNGQPFILSHDELDFAYRHSALSDKEMLVTRVSFRLFPGKTEELRERMAVLARQRREKQPLEFPSAGSTFKRPAGAFAAKLIDECGLRGFSVGGAMVSEKHAGFVINYHEASAADVLRLMAVIEARVFDHAGIHLEPEIRILGEDL